MKKSVIVLLSVLFVFFVSTNQSFAQFKLKVGPSVGMNFNIASGDLTQDTYSGLGMVFGGQLDMSFSPMIGLITNINFYDGKYIGNSTSTNNNVEVDDDVSLGYFEIQPLFKLAIPKSGFYFFAGPGMGFNIQAKDKFTVTQGNNNPEVTSTTLKNMAFRFEIKAGSGFDIKLSSLVDLSPELSFAYGLTDVFSKGKSWKVMSINLSTVCKFNVL